MMVKFSLLDSAHHVLLLSAAPFRAFRNDGRSTFAEAIPACSSDTGGATYSVGPGKTFATIGAAPLDTLEPGDHVCIYPGTYREKFVINRSGTAEAPIVVKGVPDASGNLPVIDGDGAVTPLYLDYWGENRNLVKIGGASLPSLEVPEHVRIEGLRIQNARMETGVTYTDDGGVSGRTYAKNAACVHIERGRHIHLVGNEIAGCGNGIFVSPGYSEDINVERNYIYGNGHPGSYYEHNVYTEANGIAYKYNRFGPLCPTCSGNNLKDRSAGLEIAYNFIEGGNRQLDIVDSSNYNNQPTYANTPVYGNVFIETDVNSGNRQMVHYGGDGSDTTLYRKGTIHFYHNTLLSTRSSLTTLVRLSTDETTMDARNNIIYASDGSGNLELLAEKRGTLYLTNNWLRPGYFNWVEALHGGSITEVGTVLESTGIFDDPNFLVSHDLRLNAPLNNGANLDPGMPTIDEEYVMHMLSQARSDMDLGAFGFSQSPESTPSPTSPPSPPPSSPPTTFHPTTSPTLLGFCSDRSGSCLVGGDASECGCFGPLFGRTLLKGSAQSLRGSQRRKLAKKGSTPEPTSSPTKSTPLPTQAPTKTSTSQPTQSPTSPAPCECFATAFPTYAPIETPTQSPSSGCHTKNALCDSIDPSSCCSGECKYRGQSWKCA